MKTWKFRDVTVRWTGSDVTIEGDGEWAERFRRSRRGGATAPVLAHPSDPMPVDFTSAWFVHMWVTNTVNHEPVETDYELSDDDIPDAVRAAMKVHGEDFPDFDEDGQEICY